MGCLDRDFVIATPHMIPFWNPWDIMRALEGCTGLLVTIRNIRKVRNIPKHGVLEDFGCLDGAFVIVTPHMIPFWNPWGVASTLEGCRGLLVTIRKVKNVQNMGFQRILAVLMCISSLYPHIWYLFGIFGTL